MTTLAPKLITGRVYTNGESKPVTGWLVQRPRLAGSLSSDNLVPVTLLTPEGERVRDVLIYVIDVIRTEPRDFGHFTDHMLWRIAETDMGGLGERVLAELAYRERLALAEKAREESARLAVSRCAADALMGR